MKQRLLFVVDKGEGGGAEDVTRNWIRYLVRAGHIVAVLPLGRPIQQRDQEKDVMYLNQREEMTPLSKVCQVRRVIREWKPDVVLSVLTFQNLTVSLAGIGTDVPHLMTEHSVPGVMLSSQSVRQRMQAILARFFYRRCSVFVAVSHGVAADLQSRFRVEASRIVVLPNAISHVLNGKGSSLRPSVVGPESATTEQTLRLVVPARLVSEKNPGKLLRVAEVLASRGYTVEVRFIGDGPLSTLLASNQSAQNITVSVEPWRADWPLRCDPGSIVILTSVIEGFGNTLIQATRAGFKTVAPSTAIGVGDAIVDGLTGCLAERDSIDAIAAAVIRAASIPAGVDWTGWTNRFDIEFVGPVLERVLAEVVVNGKSVG